MHYMEITGAAPKQGRANEVETEQIAFETYRHFSRQTQGLRTHGLLLKPNRKTCMSMISTCRILESRVVSYSGVLVGLIDSVLGPSQADP